MTRLVLSGATVVDGTAEPGKPADVVIDGDRIVAVESPGAGEGDRLDLEGLVLAPGFIDNHTHLDAQVLWDRDVTPSSWHGITTVILGNCGFTLAPHDASGRHTLLRMLENVEGMPLDALEAGVKWSFESFGDYLETLRGRRLRLNTAAMVGHSTIRYMVMGEEATERPATAHELEQMKGAVRTALGSGAIGFSTSKSRTDTGVDGKPVPSQVADLQEICELARVLGEAGRGTVQIVIGSNHDHVGMTSTIAKASGRPVTWGAVLSGMFSAGDAERVVDACETEGRGLIVPQMACRPVVQEITLSDPMVLSMVSEAFREVLACPRHSRAEFCSDPDWRARVRCGITEQWMRRLAEAVITESPTHPDLVGRTVDDFGSSRGLDAVDAFVDLSIQDDLDLRVRIVLLNDDPKEIERLLNDRRVLLGLSDAGAHLTQLCDANFSTYLLGHWVRERQAIPLEVAVWRLTAHPAGVFGITDRGTIKPDMAADLVAFDPHTVGTLEAQRVRDLPGGAERLLAGSTGIEYVWVNGAPIRTAGVDVDGASSGRVLRSVT
jgi:N-acyl-D-aspartate/D-glutamate deacylase